MNSHPPLPSETWDAILSFTDAPAWKELRLSCRYLKSLATPYLFGTVKFELTKNGCATLRRVANHPKLSLCVRKLVLQITTGLRDFGNPRKWRWALDLPGRSDGRFAHLSRAGDAWTDDAGFLTHAEWLALPFLKKAALYTEYEAERKQYERQNEETVAFLQFCMPESTSTRPVHPTRSVAAASNQDTTEILLHALGALTNLTAFMHTPRHIFRRHAYCSWRNLRFNLAAVRDQTSGKGDEDAEALQLSVALQTIGRASALTRLERISFIVDGPAFWGWKRLRHLWNGRGCGWIRNCRDEFDSALEADRMAFQMSHHDDEEEQRQKEDYVGQLVIMKNALCNLTRLDCFVTEDGYSGALSVATDHLFEMLCGAGKIQALGLGFRGPRDGNRARELHFSDIGPTTLLNRLAEREPWVTVREIHLSVVTDKGTLLKFLAVHRNTLRTLRLSRTTLTSSATASYTWDSALYEIGKTLELDNLKLSELCDVVPQDNGVGRRMRVLFDPTDRIWRKNKQSYCAFYKNAVQRILRAEAQVALEPEACLQPIDAELY